jgi:arylformamidase
MKIIDITPVISSELAVFPGDQSFEQRVAMSFEQGHHLKLSSMVSTLHLGAHTDAPSHYHPEGKDIDEVDVKTYIGLCQVIDVSVLKNNLKEIGLQTHSASEVNPLRILLDEILGLKIEAPRVIFKTGSFDNPNQWTNEFRALSADLIHYLADQGVKLVGIDTPSIDPATDKVLESHHAVYQRSMAVLEGVILSEVPAGLYTLIAPPLKIKGADAAPVRALLIPQNCNF